MKVTLNWLREFVDIEMSPNEVGDLLTMAGLEMEGLEAFGQSLDDILVARVLKVRPHPGADRLYVCDVDTGVKTFQVVCGAPNVEKGVLAAFAPPGAKLPDGTVIKEDEIRGQISKGMLLAEDEMGLTDDHEGIMILSPDFTPGDSFPAVYPLSDFVFDISITPNRPDCTSVIGIAREIAALTGKSLRRPDTELTANGPHVGDLTRVTIEDPLGCPRYAVGMIQDVQIGPSPFWMRYRLYLCGIRSINNIVDVTNYVLMEMGQPLHAFDYNRLRENRIVVRRAKEGDSFTTLDGQSRPLDKETLMICDGERQVAVAGIMGGLNSEIFAGTRHVLVESAFFDPVTIRRGSKKLGLSTEASYRFERGVDIEGVTTALKRSLLLISRVAGGKIAKGLVDNYPKIYMPRVIDLKVDKTNRFLGTRVSKQDINGYLKALELTVHDVDDNTLRVEPPAFRIDIVREVDLIEEVARMIGFDKIPVTYPNVRFSEEKEAPELTLRDQAKSIMAGLGFSEIISYSFVNPDSADMLNTGGGSPIRSFVELLNPLSVDQSVMRTSLIPGLLSTAKTNIVHGDADLKLFEWGRVFIREEGQQQPLETPCLAAIMTGLQDRKTWYSDERQVDFYDVKGAVEALMKKLGLSAITFQRGASPPWYDTDFSSSISISDVVLGQMGRVSSEVLEAYEYEKGNVYLFELDAGLLLQSLKGTRNFQPFPKFPAVYRDISIVLGREQESARITEIIRRKGGKLVESVHVFDLYEGKKIDPSEKAIAFNICYRSDRETLDGVEVNRLHDSIIDSIRKETGGRLREG